MSRLSFKVRLRLLLTGGRKGPIFNDYRPSWDLKNTWLGDPILNDGRVLLDDVAEIAPGTEGPAIIEPLAEEFWGAIDLGAVLPMQEGSRIVGYATVVEVTRPEHFTRETAAFVDQAHQFCDFIERASTLPLRARLDAAFDRGFITVQDDGAIVVSDALDRGARALLGLHEPLRVRGITDAHRGYLPWHRQHVFNRNPTAP